MFKYSKAEDVPGYINENQIKCIRDTASQLPKGSKILEIGCGYGKSTWAWLDELDSSCTLDVVDSWELGVKKLCDDSSTPDDVREFAQQQKNISNRNAAQKKLFEEIISLHPKFNLLKNIYSEETEKLIKSKTLSNNYNLVYIDGDHTYNSLYKELLYFSNVDILCGDDYNFKKFKPVTEAVNDFISIPRSNRVLEVDTTSFFWKITFKK